MSDEPNFTMSCYATDADLYKAKAAYYEAKVEELTAALKSIISETDEWVCCHDVNQIAKNALSWKVSDE